MKRMLCFLLLAFNLVAFSQQDKPVAVVSPDKPKNGDEITFTYNTDAGAAQLKTASSVTLQALIYHPKDSPLLIEIPMKKDGPAWKGSFTLKVPESNLIIYRFKGNGKVDDNRGDIWDAIVYAADGRAAKSAHLNRSSLFQFGGFSDFAHVKDLDIAAKEAALEKEIYPDNLDAYFALWNLQMKGDDKETIKAGIRKELDEVYAKNKSMQASLGTFVYWYNNVGDSATAKKIHDAALVDYPKGDLAQGERINAIYDEGDPEKRIVLLENFRKDFPDYKARDLEGVRAGIARLYISRKELDKAAAYLEKCEFPVPNTSNTLALQFMNQEGQLAKAVYWAKKALWYTEHLDMARKPSYMNEGDYREGNKSTRSNLLDTYGKCLVKKGDFSEASKVYEEGYAMGKGEDINVNTHYVDVLTKAGDIDKACQVALDCLKSGKSGDDLITAYRAAYTKQKGSDAGFDAVVADARKAALEKMKEDILASRLQDKPEIDFTLKDLDGKAVTLSALKGKVVVVDFWATWCGPCKESFPHLQKVYDKYKENKGVQFFALNTWESKFPEYDAQLTNAKIYMGDNKYTFPVLIDQGAVIDKYGVDGIPTQFIIDKKGNISFKTVGYEGPQMEDQLSMQIDVLLDETIGMR